jgi:hypothetical protein
LLRFAKISHEVEGERSKSANQGDKKRGTGDISGGKEGSTVQ